MPPKVTFIVAAEHAQAIQGFLDVSHAIKQTGEAGQQAGAKAAQGAKATGDAWRKSTGEIDLFHSGLGKIVTVTSAVALAIQGLRTEYQRLKEVGATALDTLKSGSEAMSRGMLTLSPATRNDAAAMRRLSKEQIGPLIRSAGSMQAAGELWANAAPAMSGIPDAEILELLRPLAKLGRDYGLPSEDAAVLSAAAARTSEFENRMHQGQKWTAKAGMGILTQLFQFSQVPDLQRAGKFEGRTLAGGIAKGYRPDTIASELTAMEAFSGDREGRLSSAAYLADLEQFDKAIEVTFSERRRPPGFTNLADVMDLPGEERRALITDKSTAFGKMGLAYLLGIGSRDPKIAGLARRKFGKHYLGALHGGRAGMQNVNRQLVDPDSPVRKKAAEIRQGIAKTPEEAEAAFDALLTSPLATEQQQVMQMERERMGAEAEAQWNNMPRAAQAVVQRQVEGIGMATGVDPFTQKFRNIDAVLSTQRKTPTELARLRIKKYRQSISDLQHDAWMRRKNFIEPYRAADPRPELTPGEVSQIGGFEEAIREQEDSLRRGATDYVPPATSAPGIAPAAIEPATSGGGAALDPVRHKRPDKKPIDVESKRRQEAIQRDSLRVSPAATDSSMMRDLIDNVQQLVSVIQSSANNRQLDIAVDDKSGRPLSRATSRPRAIELFYDDAPA